MTNWRQTLEQTRRSTFGRVATLLGDTELTPAYWESLEAALIQADLGVDATLHILGELQTHTRQTGVTRTSELHAQLRASLIGLLDHPGLPPFPPPPAVHFVVGVNGCGKTTSAAKLAYYWARSGRQVLLGGADTFRDGAGPQLELWASRVGVGCVIGTQGSDPGAAVYEAAQAAIARRADLLIVDTSGRMHTRHNLMTELEKLGRVAHKVIPGAPHQVFLVLDATTGQNGVEQARAFSAAAGVTALILAKLDHSARGGVAIAARRQLGLPIAFVGTGEAPEDLAPFEAAPFVDALLS